MGQEPRIRTDKLQGNTEGLRLCARKSLQDRRYVLQASDSFELDMQNHNQYHAETAVKKFRGNTLAYVTPWCAL